jgi:hypothetical protein
VIASGLVLTGMLVAVAVAPGPLTGPRAAAVSWLGSGPAGRLLTGLVQVTLVLAATGTLAVALRHRRFRLLAGLVAGAAVAGADTAVVRVCRAPAACSRSPRSWPCVLVLLFRPDTR